MIIYYKVVLAGEAAAEYGGAKLPTDIIQLSTDGFGDPCCKDILDSRLLERSHLAPFEGVPTYLRLQTDMWPGIKLRFCPSCGQVLKFIEKKRFTQKRSALPPRLLYKYEDVEIGG